MCSIFYVINSIDVVFDVVVHIIKVKIIFTLIQKYIKIYFAID